MLKLAGEVAEPITSRYTVAAERVKAPSLRNRRRVRTGKEGRPLPLERPPFCFANHGAPQLWRSVPCEALARQPAPCHIYRAIWCSAIQRYIAGRRAATGDEDGTGLGVATRTRTRTKSPSPYKVLMLNDDYTPMEFVVQVLQSFFKMSIEDATRVMLHVHQRGVGVCGIFRYEVAETKVAQVIDFARQNQHPLQCTLEKA